MGRIRSKAASIVLVHALLGGVALPSGCGTSSAVSEAEQPPKNRVEGLQRIGEANKKHDAETASVKNVKKPRR